MATVTHSSHPGLCKKLSLATSSLSPEKMDTEKTQTDVTINDYKGLCLIPTLLP